MAGTKEGSRKAAETNKRKYGPDFYKKIGSKSWQNPDRSRRTGFALNTDLAKEAGSKGGKTNKGKTYKKRNVKETPVNTEAQGSGTGVSE